jgi:biopolymer transport protein TolQ
MGHEPSLWSFVTNAGAVVKIVMLILLAASLCSWTVIFQKFFLLRETSYALKKFTRQFWSSDDLGKFYAKIKPRQNNLRGIEQIFLAGFSEYFRLKKQQNISTKDILVGTDRTMRIALAKEISILEQHLSFLATVGSITPYIGLFGTVWGIMTSFQALGGTTQATIAMVAPGISEALIATALGLFAAIPAVIAYNRFANDLERFANSYDIFKEEFLSILHHQTIR